MLISVGHDIFYNFSSGVINAKHKGKNPFFVAHFHKVFRPRPLIPFDVCPTFCGE